MWRESQQAKLRSGNKKGASRKMCQVSIMFDKIRADYDLSLAIISSLSEAFLPGIPDSFSRSKDALN